MKKLITLALLTIGLNAVAKTPYFWTNGVPLAATNYTIGTKTFYLTTNQVKGVDWALKSWNTTLGLSGTNRLDWKDSLGYAWFLAAEDWGKQAAAAAQADADAKSTVQQIKAKLNSGDVSDSVLAEIKTLLGL